MGTIVQRRRSNGFIGYTAQIRPKRDGVLVHAEAQTFGKKALATEWLRRRGSELDQQRECGEPLGVRRTLRELIDWYIAEVKASANWIVRASLRQSGDCWTLARGSVEPSVPTQDLLSVCIRG